MLFAVQVKHHHSPCAHSNLLPGVHHRVVIIILASPRLYCRAEPFHARIYGRLRDLLDEYALPSPRAAGLTCRDHPRLDRRLGILFDEVCHTASQCICQPARSPNPLAIPVMTVSDAIVAIVHTPKRSRSIRSCNSCAVTHSGRGLQSPGKPPVKASRNTPPGMMRVERSQCFAVGQFHRPASFPVDHSRARVLDCALGFAGLQESNHLRSPLRWYCGTAALATTTGAVACSLRGCRCDGS